MGTCAGLNDVFDNDSATASVFGSETLRDAAAYDQRSSCAFVRMDFPYTNAEKITEAIEEILRLPIDEDAKQRILGGNLARVLGVDL